MGVLALLGVGGAAGSAPGPADAQAGDGTVLTWGDGSQIEWSADSD